MKIYLDYEDEREILEQLLFYFKISLECPDELYQMFTVGEEYKTKKEQEKSINKIIEGFKELQKNRNDVFQIDKLNELDEKLAEIREYNNEGIGEGSVNV